MKSVLKVTCIAFTCIVLFSNAVFSKTGSYTITKASASIYGLVRITAMAEDGTTYDETFNVYGLTEQQARDLIVTDLQGAGWNVTTSGTNGIFITGHGTNPASNIKQVDGGDNAYGVQITIDGSVAIAHTSPGDKNFKFSCSLPNAAAIDPGSLFLKVNTTYLLVPLDPNDTPSQAAAKLAAAMTTAGYVVTLSGADVTMDWENPANLGLIGPNIHIEMGIYNGAGGPHVAIVFPNEIANVIPTLSQWGLIIFGIILLAVGVVFIIRKKRLMNV